jgi:dihydropteroate synthase
MIPRPTYDLQIGGRRVRLGERTLIMGALNVTPDSFSDGGLYLDPASAVEHGLDLVRQGADWIDIGGESTRPGSQPVSTEQELQRVLPVIRSLRRKLPSTPISIDTTKAEVAKSAVQAGANILNDISGLRFDPRLAEVARCHKIPLILMHIRSRPQTMQTRPFVADIIQSVTRGLATSVRRAVSAGLRRSQLILDPGLGFGKSRIQNFQILSHLGELRRFGLPILVGSSRKSFVQAVAAGTNPDGGAPQGPRSAKGAAAYWPMMERRVGTRHGVSLLSGDAAAVVAAILAGAHIVRVHEVDAILPAVRIADAVLEGDKSADGQVGR